MRQILEVLLKDKARIMAVGGGMLDFLATKTKTNFIKNGW
jgi:hypothetical protein